MSRPEDIEGFELDETREQREATAQVIAQAHARDIDDLRKVLKQVEGRRVIYKRLKESKVFGNLMNQNSNLTAFNLGMREMGISLLDDLMEADPNVYFQMHREYVSEMKSKKTKKKES